MYQLNSAKSFVATVMSTKGGVTKTTNVANIGAFCATHGIKTLMIDTDVQPTLSSYYHLDYIASAGLFEFLIHYDTNPEHIISHTDIENLHLIQSNDPLDTITTHLSNSPSGILRLNDLLNQIHGYDLILIDSRGTRGITVNMAILASDLLISPLLPQLPSAREFVRGTLGLYRELQAFTHYGITLPPIKSIINCLDNTNDAKKVVAGLKDIFETTELDAQLLDVSTPNRVAYREAASHSLPIHIHSKKEAETIRAICCALFPQWADKF